MEPRAPGEARGRGFVRLTGGLVEVRILGELQRGRAPLVWLHEGLGSVSLWRDFPDRVHAATGVPAIVASRLGYGASDAVPLPRPLTFLTDEAEGPLLKLFDRLGVARATLFGHSDGASIAIAFAARFPERVERVIVEAPHLFVEDVSVTSIAAADRAYRHGPLRERLAKHHHDVDVAFRGWCDAWLDPRFRDVLELRGDAARITAPILAVQGDDDEYGTWAQIDAITEAAPSAVTTLRLPRCGHAPHRDRPAEVLAAVVRFLGTPFSGDPAARSGIVD